MCIRDSSGTPTVSAIAGSKLTLSAAQSISDAVILTFAYANDAAAEAALSEADYAQFLNQKASRDHANAAGIERIEVSAGGGDYSAKPTVTITGDGSGATVAASNITMSGSGSTQSVASIVIGNKGTDYTVADISFSAGTAAANATIAPPLGHGVDPVEELGGFFVGINTQLSGSGGSGADLTTGNDFRQIALLKNPTNSGGTTISTASTLQAMDYLDFAASPAAFTIDELMVGGTSNAQAYVVRIDGTKIYYTQNSKTGYGVFQNSETVTGQSSSTAVALKSSSAVVSLSLIHI